MNTTATIAQLATDFNMEAYAVIAALDLPEVTDDTEIGSIDGWTEAEAREVLTILAQQAADLA